MPAIPKTATTNNSLRRRHPMDLGVIESLASAPTDQLAPRALLARRYDTELAKRALAHEQKSLDRGLQRMKKKLADAEAKVETRKQGGIEEGEKETHA